MGQLFANGARAALSAGIAAGDTTLTIASGGALFPIANTDAGAVGGSTDWYKAVLDDGTNFEIVYIRTHTSASTSFTNVLRGQEGTTALSFAAGAVLGVRVTAEDMRLSIGREKLAAARTYYVGSAPAAVSFTAASANVTWAAHGLSVNAAVVLSILPNIVAFTVTLASPGVFTKTAHGYAAGRPVKFSTTGALPTGLTAGTTYYVIATGLTADAFQVSATVGGAAVNTSGSQSGTHYAETTGVMPTFSTAGLLVAGTVYYVKTVVDANNVTLSSTAGGTALGTCTVATGTPIYSASTGSDSNTGLSNTSVGAFLTLTAFGAALRQLDLNGFVVTAQLAAGTYTAGLSQSGTLVGATAADPVVVQGDSVTPGNVIISTTSANCFETFWSARVYVKDLEMRTTTSGTCLYTAYGGYTRYGNVRFGACASMHVNTGPTGVSLCVASYAITGGALAHHHADQGGVNFIVAATITLTGTPAFSAYFAGCSTGSIKYQTVVFSGAATGSRFFVHKNGCIDVSLSVGTGLNFLPGNSAGTAVTTTYGSYAM